LTARLAKQGIEAFVVELTRPDFGVPVARVLCPALEKEPSTVLGGRLRVAIDVWGGGEHDTANVPLM
jgi:ribosomal protein S12 methylthiotransferase accessory factor